MMKKLAAMIAVAVTLCAYAVDPIDKSIDISAREDGLNTSSLSMVRSLIRSHAPECQFNDDVDFSAWQGRVAEEMTRLMRHPEAPAAEPRLVASAQRPGYRIERWETFPLPDAVVGVFVLIPDGVDADHPARGAALCIPGFGQTKELLAGEAERNYMLEASRPEGAIKQASMARFFAEQGLVAVAVDNVSAGELSDNGRFDYVHTARHLLELGWSWLGLTSWQDRVVLDWMKTLPGVPADRIIVSGFSLGTEPLMVLGVTDPSIYAFVYNDFLCRTRERILSLTAPDDNGYRQFPNNIDHLIPGFLAKFDFPDLVAAMAPRPVICTEGGLDRDFRLIQRAYARAGAPTDAFEYHHYAMFEADSTRSVDLEVVPAGIDKWEYFRLCNVDPPHHYFKTEHVRPWLDRILPKR